MRVLALALLLASAPAAAFAQYINGISPSANVVPAPPAGDVFLGVAIPANAPGFSCTTIQACVCALQTNIGRSFAMHNTYWGWSALDNWTSDARISDASCGDKVLGIIPVLKVNCANAQWFEQIAQGAYDSDLAQWAAQFESYAPAPVMLDFAWEINNNFANSGGNNNNCFANPHPPSALAFTGAEYGLAFRHIVVYLRHAGVTNVSYVYDPEQDYGSSGAQAAAANPGNDVFDWIACDSYDGRGAFNGLVVALSSCVRNSNAMTGGTKPIMVNETGEINCAGSPWTQPQFLVDAGNNFGIGAYPGVHALLYWDSAATYDFHLDSGCGGLAALKTLGALPNWNPTVP